MHGVSLQKSPSAIKRVARAQEPKDSERVERIRDAIKQAGVDYLVAISPQNIRMLTGYWPVVATSVALFGRSNSVLIVPEDEAHLTSVAWVEEVRTFEAGSATSLASPVEHLSCELIKIAHEIPQGKFAIDEQETVVPTPYPHVFARSAHA